MSNVSVADARNNFPDIIARAGWRGWWSGPWMDITAVAATAQLRVDELLESRRI